MGHDAKATKYQIRLKVNGYGFPPMSWNCKRDGRPTEASLRKYVESFEASTRKGGANDHLGVTTITRAMIMLNDGSRKVVVSYEAPGVHRGYMFEVVSEYHI